MLLSGPEKLIVNALNGVQADWPSPEPCGFAERLIEVSDIQSTHALLHHQLERNAACQQWPQTVQDSLRQESQRLAAVDLLRRQELTIVLEELGKEDIHPLIFKGAALAYSHYPSPSLRTRNDTDLLIRETDRATTTRLLNRLGYIEPNAVSGKLISYESMYRKTDKYSVTHVLDVHVRINNSQIFAQALAYDELAASAVPVPILGTNARGLSLPHALLLACMHRAAHLQYVAYYNEGEPYYEGNLFIWLYDIHLLATSMNADEWNNFVVSATAKSLRSICLDALQTTSQCFQTLIPEQVSTSFTIARNQEVSAAYLSGSKSRVAFAEFSMIPGLNSKIRFLWENLFPPAEYMLQKYDVSSKLWLPVLYPTRVISGMLKRMAFLKSVG